MRISDWSSDVCSSDLLVGLAVGTTVENSGTIAGESNDGVRLIGGGSVTNGGTISGAGRADADGISMYAYEGQASEDYAALVTNAAGGAIAGERFGVILSGGGDVASSEERRVGTEVDGRGTSGVSQRSKK